MVVSIIAYSLSASSQCAGRITASSLLENIFAPFEPKNLDWICQKKVGILLHSYFSQDDSGAEI